MVSLFRTPPDRLFHQYGSLIPDFPDDTTGWTMQLSHEFFDTLDKDIQDRLSDGLYTLPILSGLPGKIESIAALHSVRSEAVKDCKATSRYHERFTKYLYQIGSSKNHTFIGQLQLTQPVASVPVIKLEHEEETNSIFYMKEGFERKSILWSQQPPANPPWQNTESLIPI